MPEATGRSFPASSLLPEPIRVGNVLEKLLGKTDHALVSRTIGRVEKVMTKAATTIKVSLKSVQSTNEK